ncbi:MAG: deoxyribonuclease IV [Candidatus Micrarchaeia archaeon]
MKIRIGFHMSIAGSVANAPLNAGKAGYGALQMFVSNSRSWNSKQINDSDISLFKSYIKEFDIKPYAHMPYLCNPSSPNSEVFRKSVSMMKDNIEKCSTLGIPYIVLHPGSHLGKGFDYAMKRISSAISEALDLDARCSILLENEAGYKNSVGSKISELANLIDFIDDKRLGVCFDTCHAFAAGYDISKEDTIQHLMDEIDEFIGTQKVKLVHLNDARYGLGSGLDRHWHIGRGSIGVNGFINFFKFMRFNTDSFIMETPVTENFGEAENAIAAIRIIKKALGKGALWENSANI